jgi:ferredoxin
MRVVVDLTRCQGYAQCAFLAPDVFRMRGDEALLHDPEPADSQREQVLRAAGCLSGTSTAGRRRTYARRVAHDHLGPR